MQTKSLRWIAYPTTRIIWNLPSMAVGREETIHAINRLREAGCDLSAACAERGISRATYYRWQQRDRHGGARGLTPRSRQPRRCQTARCQIIRWRLKTSGWSGNCAGLTQATAQATVSQGFGAFRSGIRSPCFPATSSKTSRQYARCRNVWCSGHTTEPPQATPDVFCERSSRDYQAGGLSRYVGFRLTAAANSWPGLPVVNKRACQDGTVRIWGIELYVLLPRRPQYNGCVERVNRTVREEFYSQYQGEVDLASVIKGWPNTSTDTITSARTGR